MALQPPPAIPPVGDTLALGAERIHGRLLDKLGAATAYRGDVSGGLALVDSVRGTFARALRTHHPRNGELRTYLARSHVNRGDFAGHPSFTNVGRPEAVLADYRAARAELAAVPDSARIAYTDRLAGITYEREGTLLVERGDFAGARRAYAAALAFHEELAARPGVG